MKVSVYNLSLTPARLQQREALRRGHSPPPPVRRESLLNRGTRRFHRRHVVAMIRSRPCALVLRRISGG